MLLAERKQFIQALITALPERIATIPEFVRVTNFNVDALTFQILWSNIKDESDIYLSEEILDWIGYTGDYNHKKKHCLDILKSKNIEFIDLNYEQMEKHLLAGNSADKKIILPTGKGSKNTHFYFIKSDNLTKLLMVAGTTKSTQCMDYFITLDKLFKFYCEYQAQYESNRRILEAKEKETQLSLQLAIKSEEEDRLKKEIAIKSEEEEKLKKEIERLTLKSTYKELKQITIKSPGGVYCAADEDSHKKNYYKIGRSDDIDKRANQLKTSLPFGFSIYYEIKVYNTIVVEKILHQILDATRITGSEFFNYELKRIKTIIKTVQNWEEELFIRTNSIISLDTVTDIEFKIKEVKHKIKKEIISIDDIKETEAKQIIAKLNITDKYSITSKISQDEFVTLMKKYYKPSIKIKQAKDIAILAEISNIIRWNKS
jgi:hypothetical protein